MLKNVDMQVFVKVFNNYGVKLLITAFGSLVSLSIKQKVNCSNTTLFCFYDKENQLVVSFRRNDDDLNLNRLFISIFKHSNKSNQLFQSLY